MPVSVTMPALGESVTEGTVTRWLKQEGERVEADEPLLEVSTDKVDTEIPSPAAGVLTKIVVQEDETVQVGSELAVIAGDGEGGAASAAPQAARQAPSAEHAPPAEHAPTAEAAPPAEPAPGAGAEDAAGAAPGAEDAAEPAGAGAQPAAQPAQRASAAGAAPGQPAPAAEAAQTAPAGAAESKPVNGSRGPSTVVTMPALGESGTEGTVTRWLKQVGA